MEFALMANVTLRGACLREADMSGLSSMPPCSSGRTSVRRTCVAPASVMQSWTRPTSAMHGSVARSWSGPRCVEPIYAARICVWQGWTLPICPMPIWRVPKA
jgi:hypothetical protein